MTDQTFGAPAGITRRGFLLASTAVTATALFSLRSGAQPTWGATPSDRLDGDYARLTGSHWGSFTALVQDGRLVATVPFEADRYPTPMIHNFPALAYDPTRVSQPMVREGFLRDRQNSDRTGRGREPFVPVDWDTALDLVAEELERVRSTYGNEAIYGGSYGWASAGRLHACDEQTNRFLSLIGGYVDDVTNYSYGAGMTLLPHVLGDNQAIGGPVTTWDSIRDHTELFVMIGGAVFKNGQISWGGCGEHTSEPGFRAAVDAGMQVIAINPVLEDEAAEYGAEWLPIRPNTDTALLLALTWTLVEEDLADLGFLASHTTGWARVRPYLAGETDGTPKTAEWAASITEIPAETIRTLARRMAGQRTMLSASWALQRADHGEQSWWATILLASALGQIGLPGGGFAFSYGSTNGIGASRSQDVSVPGMHRGRNPLRKRIPVARIADMLLNPGARFDYNGRTDTYPEIKLIYWAGGNPFHHHQDLNRLTRAWAVPETVIVHEPFWTATARRADIVLPATTTLERNDISFSTRDRWLVAMKQVIRPVGQARNDFDIYADLADRFGVRSAFTEDRDERAWLEHFYTRARDNATRRGVALPSFEGFWEAGSYQMPEGDCEYVYLADFRTAPERFPLYTDSGKIELYSERIASFGYDCCPPHPTWLEPFEWLGHAKVAETPLHLISSHPQWRLHSQMDNGPYAKANKVAGREPIHIHPDDATARGLADGDLAEMVNERGAAVVGVKVTDRVRPGVVVVYEGVWFDPERPGEPGSRDKHGSPNMVTRDIGTSKLGQGCTAQTVLVDVRRIDAAPTVTVYDPPPIAAA